MTTDAKTRTGRCLDHQLVVCLTLLAIEVGFFFRTIHIMSAVAADSEYLTNDETWQCTLLALD